MEDEELPDPTLFWRWVGKATRPVIGWVLIGFAALLILLGWIGVSGTPIVAKQVPYIVSGGIAGVLLAVVGAYFLATEEMRKDSDRINRLERMVEQLHEVLLTGGETPAPVDVTDDSSFAPQPTPRSHPPQSQPRPSRNGSASFVVLAGSDTYHRSDCPMISGKENTAVIAPSTVRRRNLQPCALCEPAAVLAR